MKKTYRLFFTIALLMLCSLSIMAQLNGTGYYRVKNAGTGNYISLENNKFDYQTIIATAGNGAKHMFDYKFLTQISDAYGVPAALSCAGAYLKTDIHMVNDSECELPSTVIYLKQNSGDSYDIQAQSTGLVQLTTGSYKTSNISCTFKDLYATVKKVSGTGVSSMYSVSEKLTGTGVASVPILGDVTKTITIGTEYFMDEGSNFAMTESYSSSNNKHKWYIEPVTAINVTPSTSFGGKHYTTYYTAFPYTIGGNILNAYAVSNINEDGTLEIEAIVGTVPACTPVLLECSSMTGNHIVPTGTPTVVTSDTTPTSSYTGTNLLNGTFFSNTDGNMYFDNYTGTTVGTQGTTVTDGKFFNANNYTATANPQKFVLGITESGKLGFVKATGTAMPANKAWLEYTGTEELVLPFEEPTKPGDVNRDGVVDVQDITAMVNIILGKDDPTYDYEAAELDGNDGITVGDLTVLVNIILNN